MSNTNGGPNYEGELTVNNKDKSLSLGRQRHLGTERNSRLTY